MFQRKNVVLTRGSARPGERPDSRDKPAPAKAHPGIRPSLATSVPCVSSGSRTLDKAIGHGGVPIGSLTLLEEHGATDFSSALLRSLGTLAVSEAREGVASKVICVGIPDWLRALPSLAKPGKHYRSSSSSSSSENSKIRIAWRYAKYSRDKDPEQPSPYCKDVDFKSTLHPAPQQQEVAYVLGRSLDEIAQNLQTEMTRTPKNVLLRVLIPSFLHPVAYTNLESNSSPQKLYPFIAKLKQLLAAHSNAVAFISLPLQLYARDKSVTAGLELICDTCIELEPFDSGDPNVQGFLHINRIAGLTDRGEVAEQRRELSFRLTRHQFEVSPYSIPVEAADDEPEPSKEDW